MAKKKRSRRGKNAGELPQAAPLASDSDDELDDDDVAFVSAHASYARGIANLAVDAIRAGKKRKTRPSGGEDDENRTTAYEREHVASRRRAEEEEEDAKKKKKKKKREPGEEDDDDDADATRAADRRDGHLHREPLPLPVKRLDGTVVHAPTAPAPISGDGVDDVLDALPKAARAALEKAREGARDAEEEDGKMMPGAKKGKKAKRAAEMAEEMARTEYAQRASEKWWEGKEKEEEDADGGGGDDGGGDSDDDGDGDDPAAAARRARSAAAEALEAELDDENRRVAIRERIATACRGVLEDPESRWKELRDVAKLVEDRDGDVARMAALSMVLVFKARSFSSPTLVPVRPRRCGEG